MISRTSVPGRFTLFALENHLPGVVAFGNDSGDTVVGNYYQCPTPLSAMRAIASNTVASGVTDHTLWPLAIEKAGDSFGHEQRLRASLK